MLKNLKNNLIKYPPTFRDYMVLSNIQPHTRPVESLTECCSGVITAQYYFCARYFDLLDDETATAIVSELELLQNTTPESDYFGCMRWYREETFITDTNGAFFVLLPVALAYKLCGHKLTAVEKTTILRMMERAAVWFLESTKGALYYCNKIMSDGAMLALIADITGEHRDDSQAFWQRWNTYVDTNGWGWGENSSDTYSRIMLNALNVTILAGNETVREIARQKREKLLDYIAFHGGGEFIPSIRTYNFEAKADYGGSIYQAFHENGIDITHTHIKYKYEHIMNAIILLKSEAKWPAEVAAQTFRKEHLYGNSYAFTWKEKQIALGSVSHFPVMPFSYQNEAIAADGKRATFGLGWQSMPVSAKLDDIVCFLRIRSRVTEKEYSHPAVSQHNAFLYNRLFENGNITVFSTIAAQQNNLAIVTRYANKLANTASGLWDEWCIPGSDSTITETHINGHRWYLVAHKGNVLALCPLAGISCGEIFRGAMKTYQMQRGNFQTISTEFYAGENQLLFAPRLESSWVIAVIPHTEPVKEYLQKVDICDVTLPTYEISQSAPYTRCKITCSDGRNHVELVIDPVAQMDF